MLANDNELIGRYLNSGDESAFEELVQRHSAMVLGVCRNMLLHPQDAEDAFQATFLIFSKKMDRLLSRGSVAGWLYEAAVRNCFRIRRMKGRARETEMIDESISQADEPWLSISNAQQSDLIHQEINRLPRHYREVVVLCHLEGFSRSEAAEFLNSSENSVKAALARGRNLLRRRLVRRGIAVTTLLGTLGATTAHASTIIPSSLIESTVQLCCHTADKSIVSTTVANLAQQGSLHMNMVAFSKIAAYAVSISLLSCLPLMVLANQFQYIDSSAKTTLQIEQPSDDVSPATLFASKLIQPADNQEPATRGQEDKTKPNRNAAQRLFQNGTDNRFEIPFLSRIPYIGRLFRNVNLASPPPPAVFAAPNQGDSDTDIAKLDPDNSIEYWELKLKALEFQLRAIEADIKHEESGNISQAQLRILNRKRSELYSTRAEITVAHLHLKRISKGIFKQPMSRQSALPPTTEPSTTASLTTNSNGNRGQASPSSSIPPGMRVVALKTQTEDLVLQIRVGQWIQIRKIHTLLNPAEGELLIDQAKVFSVDSNGNLGILLTDAQSQQLASVRPEQIKVVLPVTDGENSRQRVPSLNSRSTPTANVIPPSAKTPLVPGEALLIECFDDTTLNRRVVIAADSTITLPFAGVVNVQGQTVRQVQNIVRDRLKSHLKNTDLIYVFRESASSPIK